ncbi:hypothetical protein [Paraglaciecola aestuariivivens]
MGYQVFFAALGFVLSLFAVLISFGFMLVLTAKAAALYLVSFISVFIFFGYLSQFCNVNRYYVLCSFAFGFYLGISLLGASPDQHGLSSILTFAAFFILSSVCFLSGNYINKRICHLNN